MYDNEILKDAEACRLYPILMEIIYVVEPKYDLIILDPAWYYRPIFHAGIQYNT